MYSVQVTRVSSYSVAARGDKYRGDSGPSKQLPAIVSSIFFSNGV